MMKRLAILVPAFLLMVGCAGTVKYHPNGQIAEAPKDMAMLLSQQQANIAQLQAEASLDTALTALAQSLDWAEMAAESERQALEVFEERAEAIQIREALSPYRMREMQRPIEAVMAADVAKRQMWFNLAGILSYHVKDVALAAMGPSGYANGAGAVYEITDSFNHLSNSGSHSGGAGAAPTAPVFDEEGNMLAEGMPGVPGGDSQQARTFNVILGSGNDTNVTGFAPINRAEKQVFDQGVLQDSDGQVQLPNFNGAEVNSPVSPLEQ